MSIPVTNPLLLAPDDLQSLSCGDIRHRFRLTDGCFCLIVLPTRFCCVGSIYEQFTAHNLGIDVTFIMPPETTASFQGMLEHGRVKEVAANLSCVNVEDIKSLFSALLNP